MLDHEMIFVWAYDREPLVPALTQEFVDLIVP